MEGKKENRVYDRRTSTRVAHAWPAYKHSESEMCEHVLVSTLSSDILRYALPYSLVTSQVN